MGILDALLGRMGYAKLGEYGLVRTPDARIAMLHRRVLDDGLGGRIVGWRAEDPAPTVLEPMDVVPRTAVKAVEAARSSMAMASRQVPATVAAAVPPASPPPRAKRASRPPIQAQAPAPAAEDNEDEWEWQLAMARARAAAEETERAAADAIAAVALSKDVPVLLGVSKSSPVLGVAKLTPSSKPPPTPVAAIRPITGAKLTVVPSSKSSAVPPIERGRVARGSASPSTRAFDPRRPEMSRSTGAKPAPVRDPRVHEAIPDARVPEPIRDARANDSRSFPLPAPEDTRQTKAAPPRTPARPAAIAEAAARTGAKRQSSSVFDAEVTETDGRKPLPRFSARFR